jgi:hypothetical protein
LNKFYDHKWEYSQSYIKRSHVRLRKSGLKTKTSLVSKTYPPFIPNTSIHLHKHEVNYKKTDLLSSHLFLSCHRKFLKNWPSSPSKATHLMYWDSKNTCTTNLSPQERRPSYQVRFYLHWYSKLFLNFTTQKMPPSL